MATKQSAISPGLRNTDPGFSASCSIIVVLPFLASINLYLMVYDLFYRLTYRWIETAVQKKAYHHALISLGLTQNVQPKTREKDKNLRGYVMSVVEL